MRRAAKVDANQREIISALLGVGASVANTHTLGNGFPDLVASYRGVNYLIEVKGPKGTLTPEEAEWHNGWHGPVAVVRSPDDALKLIGAVE